MLLIFAVAVVLGIRYFNDNYSDKVILENVLKRHGYTLQQIVWCYKMSRQLF
jgi:hypothetical protein